jgi:hypothetical protein
VFIITDKTNPRRGGGRRCRCYERRRDQSGGVKGVGCMKDEELKIEEIEVSHTLVDIKGVDVTLMSDRE